MAKQDWEKVACSFQDDVYPREFLEAYELMECLSAADQSETLLARRKVDGCLCVAKCYFVDHPLFSHRESDIVKGIDHPLLPRFVAEYSGQASRCILREYIPGQTLASVCRNRSLSEEEVRKIGLQLCEELEYLHSLPVPVIHRDIKPQNVILREDGRVSLIDFDISRAYCGEAPTETIAFGTRGFAPPEQYGFSPADCRSDLYSLGVLLRWLLRGSSEHSAPSAGPLERIIAKCTAFDPDDRYKSAAQVKRALQYATKPHKALQIALVCIAAALVLVSAAALWIGKDRPAPPEEPTPPVPVNEPAAKVYFRDMTLNQAARASLGLNGGEPLTEPLAQKVAALYLVGEEPLPDSDSFYAAIEKWYQSERPQGSVTALDDVRLLPDLKELCLVGQQITDLTPLAELTHLEKLEIKHNAVSDLIPLAGLPSLTYVGINSNPVTDLTPLTQCPNLRYLDACDAHLYDGGVFADLGDFTYLDISNRTDSYQYLSGKEITELKIAWSELDTLDWLNEVTGLIALEINNSKVTDLSPLVNHPDLQVLNIAGLAVTDLRPLLALPALQKVTVSPEMDAALAALGDVPFTVQYQ